MEKATYCDVDIYVLRFLDCTEIIEMLSSDVQVYRLFDSYAPTDHSLNSFVEVVGGYRTEHI